MRSARCAVTSVQAEVPCPPGGAIQPHQTCRVIGSDRWSDVDFHPAFAPAQSGVVWPVFKVLASSGFPGATRAIAAPSTGDKPFNRPTIFLVLLRFVSTCQSS